MSNKSNAVILTSNKSEVEQHLHFSYKQKLDPLLIAFDIPVQFMVNTKDGQIKVTAYTEAEVDDFVPSIVKRNLVHSW